MSEKRPDALFMNFLSLQKKRHFVLILSVTQKQRHGRSKFCFLQGDFLSWVPLTSHASGGWLTWVPSPLTNATCYNQPWSNCLKCSLLAWRHKRRRLSKQSTVFSKTFRKMAAQALRILSMDLLLWAAEEKLVDS